MDKDYGLILDKSINMNKCKEENLIKFDSIKVSYLEYIIFKIYSKIKKKIREKK